MATIKSIEEKAKAYNEALERARQFSKKPYLEDSAGIVEYIFPELAESEDERIRKAIIEGFLNYSESFETFGGLKVGDIIAWLEKQGEKKHNVDQYSLPVSEDSSLPTFDESIYHPCTESVHEQESSKWSEEDEKMIRNLQSELSNLAARKLIKESTCDKYYNWLKNLKDRVQPQPKQEWSEEDEEIINNIGEYLNCYGNYIVESNEEKAKDVYKSADWIKFLKERYTWKPSDEQIIDLENAINEFIPSSFKETRVSMERLLKHLKAL